MGSSRKNKRKSVPEGSAGARGKQKKQGGNKNKKGQNKKSKHDADEALELCGASSDLQLPTLPAAQRVDIKPTPFPMKKHHAHRFLTPQDGEFERVVQTCYEGLVVDPPETKTAEEQETWRASLMGLEEAGMFLTDITQPFGLGTPCAPTMVSRCLVGDPGTTYRYLGLRMFAHPWRGSTKTFQDATGALPTAAATSDAASPVDPQRVREALAGLGRLNRKLVHRTGHHLEALSKARATRGAPPHVGRPMFNISLINRMFPSSDTSRKLKKEPGFERDQTAVSWHADSSLEHFSSIAVYHMTFNGDDSAHSDWKVAARVVHDAEGPTAGRKFDNGKMAPEAIPQVAMTLATGSTYYMLDDFNHHHQHAVLAGSSSHRFASTHRLLRAGHTYYELRDHCRDAIANEHKNGTKIWRSQMLLLDDLEFEWLRQWYIQGEAHRLQHGWWHSRIDVLAGHWRALEERTHTIVNRLRLSAEFLHWGTTTDKALTKRRFKAWKSMQKLGEQGRITGCYEEMARLLRKRAEFRELWAQREKDPIFAKLNALPIPFAMVSSPLTLEEQDSKGKDFGIDQEAPLRSYMPADLHAVANKLEGEWAEWARAGAVGDSSHGASTPASASTSASTSVPEESKYVNWNTVQSVALEMQAPWAKKLVDGEKTVELRSYALPQQLLHKPLAILQSLAGRAGRSVVPDRVEKGHDGLQLLGTASFGQVIEYTSAAQFAADASRHGVTDSNSPYSFTPGRPLYGWVVSKAVKDAHAPPPPAMRRVLRSLFSLHVGKAEAYAKYGSTWQPQQKKRF